MEYGVMGVLPFPLGGSRDISECSLPPHSSWWGKRMEREIGERHWTERQEREGGEKERAKYVFL